MGTLDAFKDHHIATNHVLHHSHCTHSPSHTFISPTLPSIYITPHPRFGFPDLTYQCQTHQRRHGVLVVLRRKCDSKNFTVLTMAPHEVADSKVPSSEPPSHDPTNPTTRTTPPTCSTPPNTEVITAPSGDPPLDGHTLPPSYYELSANSTTVAVTAGGNPPPPPPL